MARPPEEMAWQQEAGLQYLGQCRPFRHRDGGNGLFAGARGVFVHRRRSTLNRSLKGIKLVDRNARERD